jgi:putative transposase
MLKMRVYKFQLKPSKQQEKQLQNTLNLCRFTYNKFLEKLNTKEKVSRSEIQHYIIELKKDFPELKKVYSKTLQYECYRLFSNLQGLSKSKKNGNKVGRLRFKGHRWFKTFVMNQTGYKLIKINKHYDKLHLSKIGDINIRCHREIEGNIKGIIIKRKVSSWEAHIITNAKYIISKGEQEIGIDMGVLSFLHTSENEKIKNPLFMNQELEKIKNIHRKISKTKKGSKNRKKYCIKLEKVWENIDNKKKDFFHKVTTHLVNSSKFIVVEKLNIKSMTKNIKGKHYNHRNILDSSWGMFLQMLKFKAENAGIEYVEVSSKNTSKMCCKCGKLKNMPTSTRTYICSCGHIMDRDYNANINILAKGKGLTFVGEEWLHSLMNQEATSFTT